MALLWRGASLFVKTPESGAQTSIFCAVDESVENVSGLYYADCAQATPAKHALVDGEPKRLWEMSEKLTGLSKISLDIYWTFFMIHGYDIKIDFACTP